jgi:hypothetical protein
MRYSRRIVGDKCQQVYAVCLDNEILRGILSGVIKITICLRISRV